MKRWKLYIYNARGGVVYINPISADIASSDMGGRSLYVVPWPAGFRSAPLRTGPLWLRLRSVRGGLDPDGFRFWRSGVAASRWRPAFPVLPAAPCRLYSGPCHLAAANRPHGGFLISFRTPAIRGALRCADPRFVYWYAFRVRFFLGGGWGWFWGNLFPFFSGLFWG